MERLGPDNFSTLQMKGHVLYRPRPNIHDLTIVDEIVNCSSTAKDIGVTLDESLSMAPHVTAVCKSAFFHLRNISKIRKFLNMETTKSLVYAFITFRLSLKSSLCRMAINVEKKSKCLLWRLTVDEECSGA